MVTDASEMLHTSSLGDGVGVQTLTSWTGAQNGIIFGLDTLFYQSRISDISVLASTRKNRINPFSTYTWNHILLGNWGTYLSFQQGITAT